MTAARHLPLDPMDAVTDHLVRARVLAHRDDVDGVRRELEAALAVCPMPPPAVASDDQEPVLSAPRWFRPKRIGARAHAFRSLDGIPVPASVCNTVKRGGDHGRNPWVRAAPNDTFCRHCERLLFLR